MYWSPKQNKELCAKRVIYVSIFFQTRARVCVGLFTTVGNQFQRAYIGYVYEYEYVWMVFGSALSFVLQNDLRCIRTIHNIMIIMIIIFIIHEWHKITYLAWSSTLKFIPKFKFDLWIWRVDPKQSQEKE